MNVSASWPRLVGDDRGEAVLGGVVDDGTDPPDPGDGQWRWFYTQQHGDNPTYQVVLTQHGR
jgi:hypothetical protein